MPELIWDGKYDESGQRPGPPRITFRSRRSRRSMSLPKSVSARSTSSQPNAPASGATA
jgi:hypothetical protein